LQRVVHQRKAQAISDLGTEPGSPPHWRARHLDEGFISMLMVPLIAEHRVTGILSLFYGEPHTWSDPEIRYAQTIANSLALALTNLQQRETAEHKTDELQATLDSFFSGVFTTDQEGAILSWNQEAAKITGYDENTMLGKYWHVDGPRMGEARGSDRLILEAMADNDVRFSLATRYFTRADGRVVQLREAVTPLRDRRGRVWGAVCAFWDRSAELQGERAKIDFVNEVVHQLRGKVGTLLLSAQQLQRRDLRDRRRKDFMQIIAGTANDLEEFNRRFAAFQREQIRDEVRESDVEVASVVTAIVARVRALKSGHRFRVQVGPEVVRADPHRLNVVLENLLENAVKYARPRSTITIRASTPSREELVLDIHNHGELISEELRSHLFERWQRGDSDKPGSGLGLWLVHAKLEEMGGAIQCESSAKAGTTFRVVLKRAPSPDAGAASTQKTGTTKRKRSAKRPDSALRERR
jgi:PAS domain S-box-containing protein